MQVTKDIEAAINIVNSKIVDREEYRPVKIFPNYSLKTFKQIKFNSSNILTKCSSMADILDLMSLNARYSDAKLSCYSPNRLDEYFINYMVKLLFLTHHKYIEYIFDRPVVKSKNIYKEIRNKLDDKTRYFFDELYKHVDTTNIFDTILCDLGVADYRVLERYIRHLSVNKYAKAAKSSEINEINFFLSKDSELDQFEKDSFSFINLGYDISNRKEEKIQHILDATKSKVVPLLKEHGKIQVFRSKKDILIDGLTRIETRSIDDPNSPSNECKKEYAYVYKAQ